MNLQGLKWNQSGQIMAYKGLLCVYQFNRLQQYKRMIGPGKFSFNQSDDEQAGNQINQEEAPIKAQKAQYQQAQPEEISYYQLGIPVDAFATLKGHSKAVSCIAVQPKGHRMATGGLDYHVRLWDFHGMNKNMNSFRIIQPFTGNAMRTVSFNTTGTHLMVINGNKQITFLDKDGARNLLTVKGYMYVKDLNLTKGHTNTVHDGTFHPFNHNEFVTASADGSIRLWDLEQKLQGIQQELAHKILIRCKDARGAYVGIRSICYSRDGKMIYSGCLDGSLQLFSTKHNHHRPEMMVRDAHDPMEQYASIAAFQDNFKLVTRNTDNTLKIWDIRNINKPVYHQRQIPTRFPGNKVCFSPDNRLLMTGTAVGQQIQSKHSFLHFYDTTTFERVKSIKVAPSSINGMCWNPAINQIILGLDNGQAMIYFDERFSKMGALKAINKQPRVDKDPNLGYTPPIYNPHSLPLYKQRPTNNIKKDLLQIRKNAVISAKPQFPTQGPHKYGRQNEKAYTQIQYIIQSLNKNPQKVTDARKPLWEIQKFTKQRQLFPSAHQFNEPAQLTSERPVDTKEYQFLQTLQKICPHCGLKLCTCIRKEFYDSQDQQDEQQKK